MGTNGAALSKNMHEKNEQITHPLKFLALLNIYAVYLVFYLAHRKNADALQLQRHFREIQLELELVSLIFKTIGTIRDLTALNSQLENIIVATVCKCVHSSLF